MSSGHAVSVAGGSGHTVTVAKDVGQLVLVAEMCPCQSGGNIDEEVPLKEDKDKDNVTPCDERVKRYYVREDVLLPKYNHDEDRFETNERNDHEKDKEVHINDENATNEDFDRTPRPSYCYGSLCKICDNGCDAFQLQGDDNLACNCSETGNTITRDDDDDTNMTEDLNRTPRNSHCFGHPYNVGLDWQNRGNRVCWDDCLHVCFLNKFRRGDCRSNSI